MTGQMQIPSSNIDGIPEWRKMSFPDRCEDSLNKVNRWNSPQSQRPAKCNENESQSINQSINQSALIGNLAINQSIIHNNVRANWDSPHKDDKITYHSVLKIDCGFLAGNVQDLLDGLTVLRCAGQRMQMYNADDHRIQSSEHFLKRHQRSR